MSVFMLTTVLASSALLIPAGSESPIISHPPPPSPTPPAPLPPIAPSAPKTLASLPYVVNAAGVAQVGSITVVAGGVQNSPYGPVNLATIIRYNVSSNSSSVSHVQLPTARRGVLAFTFGSEVFLVGGFDGSYLTEVWSYNVPNDTIRFVGHLSGPTCYGALAFDGKLAYIAGGIVNYNTYSNQIMTFDPVTGLSVFLNVTLPTARWGMTAAAVDSSIYVFGGYSDTGIYSDVVAFNASSHGVAPIVATLPVGLAESSAVVDGSSVLLPGGRTTGQGSPPSISSDVYVFTPSTGMTKILVGALPAPRFSHGSLLIAKGLLIVGGRDASGQAVATVFLLPLITPA